METRTIVNQRNAKLGAALFVATLFLNRGYELATASAGDLRCYPDTIDTSSVSLDVTNLLIKEKYSPDELQNLGPASGTIDKILATDHKKYTTSMKGDTYIVCVQGTTVIPGEASKFTVNDQ